MNNKEKELRRIVDAVVDCCATTDENGRPDMDVAAVLSKKKTENLVLTRCILVAAIVKQGYSVGTVARLLGRSVHAVRQMIASDTRYQALSRAYRIARKEVAERCHSGAS